MSKFKDNFIYFLFFFFLALSLIFLYKLEWLSPLENKFFSLAQPLTQPLYRLTRFTSNLLEEISSIQRIKKRNAELLKELNSLKIENSRLKEKLLAFQDLEKIHQFEQERNYQTLSTNIIAASYKTLLIDKGKKDGIKKGLAVVTPSGFLVGQIKETFNDYSKVLLITDKESIINIQFQETRTIALLKGNYHLGASIYNLPASEKVNLNEKIITSGRDESIPQGILVGRVTEIYTSPHSIFQEVKVNLAADFNRLEKLFIVISP